METNLTHALSNYLICMRFIRINTVYDLRKFIVPSTAAVLVVSLFHIQMGEASRVQSAPCKTTKAKAES